MNPRCRIPLVTAALSVLAPNVALADREAGSKIVFGAADVKFRGTKTSKATSLKAEGGLDFNGVSVAGGFTTSVFLKAPAEETSGSYRTRVDEFSSGWRGGLTLAYEWTDQASRGGIAHPCMVLLRRTSSQAASRDELAAATQMRQDVLAESGPLRPTAFPGALEPAARQELESRAQQLTASLDASSEDDTPSERGAMQAELRLVQTLLSHAAWAEAEGERQRRAYETQRKAFEADRDQRLESVDTEIESLRDSVAADERQLAEARAELAADGVRRAADGNCGALPSGWQVRLIGSAELGGQSYAWRPLDESTPVERARYSGAAQLTLDAFVTDRPDRTDHEVTGWAYGPALTARYSQEWRDANEVGILDSAVLQDPGVGEVALDSRIVGAPSTAPTFSLRLFSYFNPPTAERRFAFGPAVASTWVGQGQVTESIHTPFGEQLVVRAEAWLYFMPTDAGSVNTRLGIAPFFDATVMGRDPGDPVVDSGALFSFQVGKPVFRY
ncbi:MAG: hypothetical protein ACRBN8_01675 [Nannocystales bacterium]